MLSKNFSLLFLLRKPQNYVKGKMPVYMRITIGGTKTEMSIQKACEPSRWNSHSGRAKGTKEEVKVLNSYLDMFQAKVYEAYRNMAEQAEPITAENLKNRLLGKAGNPRMILELFQHHNEQVEQLVGREFSAGTLERYKTSLEHTRQFLLWKYQVTDLSIYRLDHEFISEYAYWLKAIRKCGHNTTVKYLANFKKIVLICVRNGWLARDPFIGYKLAKREVERPFLTDSELMSVFTRVFPTEQLNNVKNVFLFSCFTGLAYVDVEKLKRSEIGEEADGEEWIFIRRQKTGSSSRIPLLPVPRAILNQYKDHPKCIKKGVLLPVLSNQKMNAHLKTIAGLCGISKKLTFHIARHTFATTVTLSNGVPIETVSKMMGHKDLKTTQHYAKILDKKVGEDMRALKERLTPVFRPS